MPPRRGKWPSPGSKALRGATARARGKPRDFFSSSPGMSTPAEGFSMRDEARNTASHHSSLGWPSGDAKLRQRPVTFVSAGVIDPLKDDQLSEVSSKPDVTEDFSVDVTEPVGDTDKVGNANMLVNESIGLPEFETTIKTAEQEVIVIEPLVQESASRTSDQPSEPQGKASNDLFFFDLAEDQPTVDPSIPPPKIPSPRSSCGGSDSSEEVILFRGRARNSRAAAQRNRFALPDATIAPSKTPVDRRDEIITATSNDPESRGMKSPTQLAGNRSRSKHGGSRVPKHRNEDDEDEILADYIANMAANPEDDFISSLLQSSTTYRDLGGDDDAINLGSEDETSPRGDGLLDAEAAESEGSGSSDGEGDGFAIESGDQDMDADMDDEELARVLAKQEELGMGSDELLLFTSSFAQTGSGKSQRKRPVNSGSGQVHRGSASATQVADAFDNLDLADWSHLTGQTRKRRGKQPPSFNVSDSEMEAALKTAWQRDKERKKDRKLEREALRAEGLLGKNVNPDDLRIKYLSGMKLDDMKLELTSFLLSSEERLDFPPLDKHARKILHEIANKFNIKSQSTGKGDQRRPVLYRTNRTVRYASTRFEDAASHVEQAAVRIHRKYFHRVDVKVPQTESPRTAGGRSGHKALTLREGEIVGASVPELGQDNKGRNMLEKMGWSKGMSLGAADNKGILEPVAQVMKRSKAGLG
ncbi:hypothetical protein C8A05DRAFT_13353 [Staphylotrichum tortipilum]|uniref:Protein SQS1 n=1 Tax=Staphylotrichum tortipilum TaxID=2831512 RepID=A0AAN6MQU7_9PEZI|nr:hypothetical protein C8A05DRAFT_13353 [Staphylotrichum longicolle]